MRFNDAVFGVVLLALAIFIWTMAAGFPKQIGMTYGPAFFPQVLSVLLGGSAVLLIYRGFRSGEAILQAGPWARDPRRWLGLALVFGALLFYTDLSNLLGFHITVFLIGFVLMLYLGVRLWLALVVALAAAAVLWLLFARLLLVPLPGGLLAPILW
ncbi:MAG TPA: tripartite tricarboxylate transporter TctB family protein [Ferrovibrio sp.]|uniref:tripartite tricarboxylate transporter TctB family protein n=1 Tax=Ferrovibrio sp. TaxID=1917215 RepID=UPI002ED62DE2